MKLRFKHQKFQADAAKAIVDVFQGQPPCFQGFSFLLIFPILLHFSGYIRLYYTFFSLLLQDISI